MKSSLTEFLTKAHLLYFQGLPGRNSFPSMRSKKGVLAHLVEILELSPGISPSKGTANNGKGNLFGRGSLGGSPH